MHPKFSYYQRLLAMDQDEAAEIVEEYLKNHPREHVYDDVLLAALSSAKGDRRRNNLTVDEEQFIFDTTRKLLEKLSPADGPTTTSSGDGSQSPSRSPARIRILGCPADGDADEIGLLMLRQLLDSGPYLLEISSADSLTAEVTSRVREAELSLVCIGALAPRGLAQARYLCKRLRGEVPELKIVVGRWGVRGETDELRESLLSAGADHVATTLLETRDQIRNLRPFLSSSDESAAASAPHQVTGDVQKHSDRKPANSR